MAGQNLPIADMARHTPSQAESSCTPKPALRGSSESGDAAGLTPAQGLGLGWSEGGTCTLRKGPLAGSQAERTETSDAVPTMSLLVTGAHPCCEWAVASKG